MAREQGTRATVASRWQDRVARHRTSGLSVAEFCRRERVHPVSFYHWRRRLAGTPQTKSRRARTSRAFLPVELVTSETAPFDNASVERSPYACELVLGSLVCRVPREVDEGSLRCLIRVLLQEASRC